MARLKRKRSIKLDRAKARFAALMSIKPVLDFGNGLTTQVFREAIDETAQALIRYNTLLSILDDAYNSLIALEYNVASLSGRMLTGVAAQYGKSSSEYEMAGGTRQPARWQARPLDELR